MSSIWLLLSIHHRSPGFIVHFPLTVVPTTVFMLPTRSRKLLPSLSPTTCPVLTWRLLPVPSDHFSFNPVHPGSYILSVFINSRDVSCLWNFQVFKLGAFLPKNESPRNVCAFFKVTSFFLFFFYRQNTFSGILQGQFNLI